MTQDNESLIQKLKDAAHVEIFHGSGAQMSIALDRAIDIISQHDFMGDSGLEASTDKTVGSATREDAVAEPPTNFTEEGGKYLKPLSSTKSKCREAFEKWYHVSSGIGYTDCHKALQYQAWQDSESRILLSILNSDRAMKVVANSLRHYAHGETPPNWAPLSAYLPVAKAAIAALVKEIGE